MEIVTKFKNFFRPIDLTKGKPYKVILLFVIPILISNIFSQLYTITDAIIVGQNLDRYSIAGVNDTSSIIYIFLQFAIGFASGISVITANKIGENDEKGFKKSFGTQIILSLLTSLILTLLAIFLINPMLSLVNVTNGAIGSEANLIYKAASTYLFIIFLGITGSVFTHLSHGVLRSIGDSLTPLVFLIFSTVLNICLDLLFIIPLNLGVVGAALATIISQYLTSIVTFIYAYKKYPLFKLSKDDFKLNFKDSWEHLKLGLPVAFQFSILAIGLIALQGTVNGFDSNGATSAQISYGACSKFMSFLMAPFVALGTAMLSYCGQNKGANLNDRIIKGINESLIILLICYAFILVFGLGLTYNGTFLYIFVNSESIDAKAIEYTEYMMYIAVPFFIILGILFVYRNALQGIKKGVFPLLSGVGELVARIFLCFLPSLIFSDPKSTPAFILVSFSDPLAWTFSTIILAIGVFKYIYFSKEKEVKKSAI